MSGIVRVKRFTGPFSVVPDSILEFDEDRPMRPETRLVLAWLVGRPDDWKVYVSQMIKALGLSRDRWRRVRVELERWGYLVQIRRRMPDGRFVWDHIVYDSPAIVDGSEAEGHAHPKRRRVTSSDGNRAVKRPAIDGFSNDGRSGVGKPGDITTPSHQQDLNTPLNPPVSITQACFEEAQRRFGGYSVEHLEERWRAWVNDKGEAPKDLDKAFLAWAATYVRNHPLPGGGTF